METTNTALEEKIDLIQVLKKLWAYKKLYAISASISICFGFIIKCINDIVFILNEIKCFTYKNCNTY